VEELAQHKLDHWVRKRIDEALRHGTMRHDGKKQYPARGLQSTAATGEGIRSENGVGSAQTITALGYDVRKRQ
jgi:hypothetical protein